MEKDKVEKFAKELSDKGKLAKPEKNGFFSKVFGKNDEPSELPPPPKPSPELQLKSDLNIVVKRIDDLDKRMSGLKKHGSKEIEESFAKALKSVDKKKVEAKAVVPEQAVIIPTGRVQEFLDKMDKYGVKVENVEIVRP